MHKNKNQTNKNLKRRFLNKSHTSKVKTFFLKAIANNNTENKKIAESVIARAMTKGYLNKNKGRRLISRMVKHVC